MALIDKDAVIHEIMGQPPEPHYPSWYAEQIKALPSAQPERKKGKWIREPNVYGVVYCSECDYELHTNNTNFCPNCGAEMTQAGTESDGTVD